MVLGGCAALLPVAESQRILRRSQIFGRIKEATRFLVKEDAEFEN